MVEYSLHIFRYFPEIRFIVLVSGGNGKPVTGFLFISGKNNEIRKEYLGTGN